MKQIKGYARKATTYGQVWIIRIRDMEAALTINLNEMTGWSVEDAKRKFNRRLEPFGHTISDIEIEV